MRVKTLKWTDDGTIAARTYSIEGKINAWLTVNSGIKVFDIKRNIEVSPGYGGRTIITHHALIIYETPVHCQTKAKKGSESTP